MTAVEEKKYLGMETVLQGINKSYVSLEGDKVKRNNPIMKEIIEQILIPKMKQQNQLFTLMYTTIYYGGSFYDGLKVGKPEEYDLDLLISLPKFANPQVIESDLPGYAHVQILDMEKLKKQPEGPKYNGLEKLMDSENFILTTKFRSWVEGLIQKVLNTFEREDKSAFLVLTIKDVPTKFYIETTKSGPAFTLKVSGTIDDENVMMDIDIVPSIKCSKWPKASDYRQNPSSKKSEFFVVPKGPTREESMNKYWRLSFQDQEREILNGFNKLKPTIRLLKRLRDFQKHDSIASYYIKTIFLLTLDDAKLTKFWNSDSLSHCFMKGLELYEEHLRKHNIPFYWNRKNNLLSNIKEDTCIMYANKLKKILNEINSKVELDPFAVTKYLLSQDEIDSLKSTVNLGAKVEKKLFASQLLQSCSNSSISSSENPTYRRSSSFMNSMDSLNLDILQNSFDSVDCPAFNKRSESQQSDLSEILKELRSINSRLSVIEKKVDDVVERQKRIERSCCADKRDDVAELQTSIERNLGIGPSSNGFTLLNFANGGLFPLKE